MSTFGMVYSAGPRSTSVVRRGRRFKLRARVISSQDSLLGSQLQSSERLDNICPVPSQNRFLLLLLLCLLPTHSKPSLHHSPLPQEPYATCHTEYTPLLYYKNTNATQVSRTIQYVYLIHRKADESILWLPLAHTADLLRLKAQ